METLEKEKVLGRITGGVVHDINNVLTAILGYTEILLKKPCENCRKEIEIIKKAAMDGAAITRRVKDYLKEGQSIRGIFDINEAVETAYMITRPIWYNSAQIKGKKIAFKYNKTATVYSYGNESELTEVLVNMILNSVDAIEKDGVIYIDVAREDKQAVISIKDNGIGMSEETKNKVFMQYFTTKKESGTGLGLSTAFKTISEMGGDIEVKSKPGEGSEFKVILPVINRIQEEKAEVKRIQQTYVSNILIIDDQIEICSILSEMLSRILCGKIEICTRGRDALQLIENNNYDLILTDISMPDISGLEVIRNIKKWKPETKVIAMTGWDGFFNKGEKDIPDGILSKPFTMEELEELINTVYQDKNNLVV